MTAQIDARGNTTRFAYDIMGQLTEKTLPLGQKETYGYYPDGQMEYKIDPRGIRTDYQYNAVTQLLQSKAFSDGTRVDYTYWPDGSLKTATNSAGTTTYTYDSMGRLERVVDPYNYVISYTYDRFGMCTKVAGPGGELRYTYDILGRIETVTDQQGQVTRYQYDELGRQKKVAYANGTETVYSYDALSRLTSVVNRQSGAAGAIISSHKYTLNAAGQRIKIEEQGSVVEYGYDNLNRLTSEKRDGVVELDDSYTYDPVGNRRTKAALGGNASYIYDANDRLLSDGKYTYGWDAAGNLTSRSGPEGQTTYRYDAENRLVETSGPGGVVQYAYDAEGNRISRTTAAGTTVFVVDPNMPYAQVLEEHGPAGAKLYAYGNDMLNIQGPDGTHWFDYDGLGSVRALTDASGTLTDTYIYEAFGSVAHRTGTTANDFRFTGEQYDEALEMYYLRARYYEPGTGRFGQQDRRSGNPANPVTFNKYIYTNANPINNTDPSGLFSIPEITTSLGIQGFIRSIPGLTAKALGVGVVSGVFSTIYSIITDIEANRDITAKSVANAAISGFCFGFLSTFFTQYRWARIIIGTVVSGASLVDFVSSIKAGLTIRASLDLLIFMFSLRYLRADLRSLRYQPIDTSNFKGGTPTKNGGIRERIQFWKEWQTRYPETLSEANKAIIKGDRAPRIDATWCKYFPDQAPYMGEKLIHHHINYGAKAIPLPEPFHRYQPGRGILHP